MGQQQECAASIPRVRHARHFEGHLCSSGGERPERTCASVNRAGTHRRQCATPCHSLASCGRAARPAGRHHADTAVRRLALLPTCRALEPRAPLPRPKPKKGTIKTTTGRPTKKKTAPSKKMTSGHLSNRLAASLQRSPALSAPLLKLGRAGAKRASRPESGPHFIFPDDAPLTHKHR